MPLTLEITKRPPEPKPDVFVLDGRCPNVNWFDVENRTCCVMLCDGTIERAAHNIETHPWGQTITYRLHATSFDQLERLYWESMVYAGGTLHITVPPGPALPPPTLAAMVDTFAIAPECLDAPVALRALSEYPAWHDAAELERALATRTPYTHHIAE